MTDEIQFNQNIIVFRNNQTPYVTISIHDIISNKTFLNSHYFFEPDFKHSNIIIKENEVHLYLISIQKDTVYLMHKQIHPEGNNQSNIIFEISESNFKII